MTVNTYPVKTSIRKYIVGSSLLFFIPAVYSYSCGTPLLGFMSFFTGIASVNFWLLGMPGWRLKVDKFFAYTTATVYVCTMISHVYMKRNRWMALFYMLILYASKHSYAMSCKRWDSGCPFWFRFHVLFHILLTVVKMATIEVDSETCNSLI